MRATQAVYGLLILPVIVSGCSSTNVPEVQVGQITFTDFNGKPLNPQPTSLAPNQTIYVLVNIDNDPEFFGADWTVYCASALPPGTPLPPGQTEDLSCGSLTPAHTVGGPIPSYVAATKGAGGYVALYAAPAAALKQGTVTIYAAATKDHSQVSKTTLTIQ